jgi:cytochrome c oxidase subunit 2
MFATFFCFCDAALPWQLGFQDPATPLAEGILRFHHDLMFILIFVVVFVCWILFRTLSKFNSTAFKLPSSVVHGTTIEIIWTLIPAFILIIIAVPSFSLLYSVDEILDPALTVKIVGHQWYWSYEYSDYLDTENKPSIVFDSYILPSSDLSIGDLRLLEVDNRIVLPADTHIRLIVTSADVLHSWTIPSFGVKLDACPGRLNEASVFVQRVGVFYGQCSEICGVNHGFMPISVETLPLDKYVFWVSSKLSFF